MKFPKYWSVVRNTSGYVTARGWSENSQAEALERAEDRLKRILYWLRDENPEKDLDRYQYVIDDNICEQVVDHVYSPDGREIAVISRNVYGAIVLNSPTVMFIDIDIEPTAYQPGFFARLFGAKAITVQQVFETRMNHLRTWQAQHSEFTFRVYRTAAGLRAVVANREFSEVDKNVIEMMEQLNSDPLYRQLCISQKCFRARLSPKPWRIGLLPPTQRFPFEDPAAEDALNKWSVEYSAASKEWSVCEFLETIGQAEPVPVAMQLIELHDGLCCNPGKKLA